MIQQPIDIMTQTKRRQDSINLLQHPKEVLDQTSRRFNILVLLPLAFVTAFSFSFVLMHPYYNPRTSTASVVSASSEHSQTIVPPTTSVVLTQQLPHINTVPATISSAKIIENSSVTSQPSTAQQLYTNSPSESAATTNSKHIINQLLDDLKLNNVQPLTNTSTKQ